VAEARAITARTALGEDPETTRIRQIILANDALAETHLIAVLKDGHPVNTADGEIVIDPATVKRARDPGFDRQAREMLAEIRAEIVELSGVSGDGSDNIDWTVPRNHDRHPAGSHPRDGRGKFLRAVENIDRYRQAAGLITQGWTYQAVADHFGYHDSGTCHRAVQ
jgi:hypothetical protein